MSTGAPAPTAPTDPPFDTAGRNGKAVGKKTKQSQAAASQQRAGATSQAPGAQHAGPSVQPSTSASAAAATATAPAASAPAASAAPFAFDPHHPKYEWFERLKQQASPIIVAYYTGYVPKHQRPRTNPDIVDVAHRTLDAARRALGLTGPEAEKLGLYDGQYGRRLLVLQDGGLRLTVGLRGSQELLNRLSATLRGSLMGQLQVRMADNALVGMSISNFRGSQGTSLVSISSPTCTFEGSVSEAMVHTLDMCSGLLGGAQVLWVGNYSSTDRVVHDRVDKDGNKLEDVPAPLLTSVSHGLVALVAQPDKLLERKPQQPRPVFSLGPIALQFARVPLGTRTGPESLVPAEWPAIIAGQAAQRAAAVQAAVAQAQAAIAQRKADEEAAAAKQAAAAAARVRYAAARAAQAEVVRKADQEAAAAKQAAAAARAKSRREKLVALHGEEGADTMMAEEMASLHGPLPSPSAAVIAARPARVSSSTAQLQTSPAPAMTAAVADTTVGSNVGGAPRPAAAVSPTAARSHLAPSSRAPAAVPKSLRRLAIRKPKPTPKPKPTAELGPKPKQAPLLPSDSAPPAGAGMDLSDPLTDGSSATPVGGVQGYIGTAEAQAWLAAGETPPPVGPSAPPWLAAVLGTLPSAGAH